MAKAFPVFPLALFVSAAPLYAQAPATPAQPPAPATITVCGQQVAPPRAAPPANSGPIVLFIAPCFEAQANTSLIHLDAYIDRGLVRKVQGIVKDMLKEKGFQFATVTPEIQEMPGSPKLVRLTFHMDEGPKVKIRKVNFLGNKAVSSGALKRQMK